MAVNLLLGTFVVSYNYAVMHAFEPGPGEGASVVNFALQSVLLALVAIASLVRAPRLAWARTVGPLSLVVLLSVVVVGACYRWASVQ